MIITSTDLDLESVGIAVATGKETCSYCHRAIRKGRRMLWRIEYNDMSPTEIQVAQYFNKYLERKYLEYYIPGINISSGDTLTISVPIISHISSETSSGAAEEGTDTTSANSNICFYVVPASDFTIRWSPSGTFTKFEIASDPQKTPKILWAHLSCVLRRGKKEKYYQWLLSELEKDFREDLGE